MPTKNLERIFAPQRIAVVGASDRIGSVGQTVLRNLINGGFGGAVHPVNPSHSRINGLECFASVGDLPSGADLAVVCTPAKIVPSIVRQCGEAGILGLVILSAGFRETSPEGASLEEEIRTTAKGFAGMRIIGPNCLGIMSPHHGLNASFASDSPSKGRVAFISQSGALCTSILDWAITENVGFSQFVSVGNMIDVGIADLIDYFAMDGYTQAIILYVESIPDARLFMSAARAFTRTKPIIAYKAGRFAESAQAAASHTGAMAGVDSVYQAAFARAGIVRVFDVEDLFDCAELLARHPTPSGPRLAIVTNAGGPGVMATDALLARHGRLAQLSPDTLAKLSQHLPATWSRHNPVDVIGDATPQRFAAAVEIVLADPGVDGLVVILSPQDMTDPAGAARAVSNAASDSRKPVLASWMGGQKVQAGIQILNAAKIPTYSTPEKCVRAFMHLVTYGRNRELLYETPREFPLRLSLDRVHLRAKLNGMNGDDHRVLTECESKDLLEAYGIPVTKTELAATSDDAVAIASRLGYPVVLKIFSPEISHKTDVQGVELNVAHAGEVAKAFEAIVQRVKRHRPEANIEGVTVQPMVVHPEGRELILGAKRDPVFGPVLLVGAGGIAAELLDDQALELPPLNERLALRMLESLRSWPLLKGYRGRPGVNIDRLIEVLIRLSYLVADFPQIGELDINPLLAGPDEAIALDARIVLEPWIEEEPHRPFAHLAILPYPEEFIQHAQLDDGTSALLRPIRPEDEPKWQELIAGCSAATIHSRFRSMFKAMNHSIASRHCFIDYDREMAIVAEIEEEGVRKMAGVACFIADADRREAEYAILVGDRWQGIGLGSVLTDACLGICERWNIQSVVAEASPRNRKMIRMFEHRGFDLDRGISDDVVIARKELPVRGVSIPSA